MSRASLKRYREKKKKAGLCLGCGKKAEEEMTLCRECADKYNKRKREKRKGVFKKVMKNVKFGLILGCWKEN